MTTQDAGSRLRAEMSPVSMLEVFAHLAQGDIPLLPLTRLAYILRAGLRANKVSSQYGGNALSKDRPQRALLNSTQ